MKKIIEPKLIFSITIFHFLIVFPDSSRNALPQSPENLSLFCISDWSFTFFDYDDKDGDKTLKYFLLSKKN